MTTPAQRIADLESGAWQAAKHLERIDINLAQIHTKVDQHATALSATMPDLRDLRIDVHGIKEEVRRHTAILTAIADHLGIQLPGRQLPDDSEDIDPTGALTEDH